MESLIDVLEKNKEAIENAAKRHEITFEYRADLSSGIVYEFYARRRDVCVLQKYPFLEWERIAGTSPEEWTRVTIEIMGRMAAEINSYIERSGEEDYNEWGDRIR